jgi:cytohesin
MTATLRGQIETVETLLALSADVHAVDAYGSNLMDLAGASGNIKIVELLKGLGVKSSYPLHLAAGTGDFNQIRSLLKAGRLINEQDSFGATPLLVATVAGREDVVDYLLDRSADPTIEAKNGYTLLHGAAFSGKKSLIRKMLAFGLDLNRRYGPDAITPTDVGEEGSEGLIYLRSMGGRSAWELGPE